MAYLLRHALPRAEARARCGRVCRYGICRGLTSHVELLSRGRRTLPYRLDVRIGFYGWPILRVFVSREEWESLNFPRQISRPTSEIPRKSSSLIMQPRALCTMAYISTYIISVLRRSPVAATIYS